ncbi:MAG: hypothetical protein JNK82_08755 [Myxococcaceae bacterium]|nr:hypothetical protein [Myxococcaceae bacterium]
MTTDVKALPLKGAVHELSPLPDGRTRVTFRRLAAVYFVNAGAPAAVLEALSRSQRTGEELQLTYAFADKSLAL